MLYAIALMGTERKFFVGINTNQILENKISNQIRLH